MKMRCKLLAVLALVMSATATTQAAIPVEATKPIKSAGFIAAQNNDLARLAGVWKTIDAEIDGNKVNEAIGQTFEFDTSESAPFTGQAMLATRNEYRMITLKIAMPDEHGNTRLDERGELMQAIFPFLLDSKSKQYLLLVPTDPSDPTWDSAQTGIYKFEGSTLHLCQWAPEELEFPSAFDSKRGYMLMRLEKVSTQPKQK